MIDYKPTKNRETVGKISTDLLMKEPETNHLEEIQIEALKDYDKNIFETIDRGKKDYVGDFFIVVMTKSEKLMPNVIRNFFFSRCSCPTPTHDQTVYKFHRKEERIEELWTVPSKDAVHFLSENKLYIPINQQKLLTYTLDFLDGTLDKLSIKLNNNLL